MKNTRKFTRGQKGFTVVGIILIIAVLSGAGFIGYRVYQANQKETEPVDEQQSAEEDQKPDPTSSWKAFASTSGKFSLRYEPKWAYATKVSGGRVHLWFDLKPLADANSAHGPSAWRVWAQSNSGDTRGSDYGLVGVSTGGVTSEKTLVRM